MRLSIDGIALFFRENWQFLLSMMPVDVAYDETDPDKACLVKSDLMGSVLLFSIMTAVELAVLGITIFFFIYA